MFRIADGWRDLIKVFLVRGIVFMEEQAIPFDEEIDAHEFECVQVLGEIDGEPAAAGRIRFVAASAKLERIAVRRAFRHQGLGHHILDFMMDVARKHGVDSFVVHAQSHLQQFYTRHGFHTQGDPFEEAGIPHVKMVCSDSAPVSAGNPKGGSA